jgi:hypothetical protein
MPSTPSSCDERFSYKSRKGVFLGRHLAAKWAYKGQFCKYKCKVKVSSNTPGRLIDFYFIDFLYDVGQVAHHQPNCSLPPIGAPPSGQTRQARTLWSGMEVGVVGGYAGAETERSSSSGLGVAAVQVLNFGAL